MWFFDGLGGPANAGDPGNGATSAGVGPWPRNRGERTDTARVGVV